MTLEEYLLEVKAIEQEKFEALQELVKLYIQSNNPHGKGDIVSDHSNTIIIEKIMYYIGNNPCAVYYGTVLKKDGTHIKDGKKAKVYQSNLVKK